MLDCFTKNILTPCNSMYSVNVNYTLTVNLSYIYCICDLLILLTHLTVVYAWSIDSAAARHLTGF